MIPRNILYNDIVLQIIHAKVQERRLPMIVLDAEYQFDRHKVSGTQIKFFNLGNCTQLDLAILS